MTCQSKLRARKMLIVRLTPVNVCFLVSRLPREIRSVGTEIPTIKPIFGDKTPLNVAKFVPVLVSKDCFVRTHCVMLDIENREDWIAEGIRNQSIRLPCPIRDLQTNEFSGRRQACHASSLALHKTNKQ